MSQTHQTWIGSSRLTSDIWPLRSSGSRVTACSELVNLFSQPVQTPCLASLRPLNCGNSTMLKTNENRPGVVSGELKCKKPRVRTSLKAKHPITCSFCFAVPSAVMIGHPCRTSPQSSLSSEIQRLPRDLFHAFSRPCCDVTTTRRLWSSTPSLSPDHTPHQLARLCVQRRRVCDA